MKDLNLRRIYCDFLMRIRYSAEKSGFTLIRTRLRRNLEKIDIFLRTRLRRNLESVHAFTLIELLVVIAIVAVLSTVGLVIFPNATKRARDAQRKSDLGQYKVALENFAGENKGKYPSGNANGTAPAITICASALDKFMSSCLEDSKKPADYASVQVEEKYYGYNSNGNGTLGTPTATKYFLYVHGGLEAVNQTFVLCYDGRIELITNDADAWEEVKAFCPI